MKRVVTLTACAVALVLVTAALGRPALLPPSPPLPTSPATIEVSPKTNLTANSEYDRNPSIVKSGSNYWLFYTKGDNTTTGGVRGVGYNPDNDTYMVYYKTASTIAGLAGASETQLALSRPANFDQRVCSAVVVGTDIYAIVSSGQSGTDRGMYYYKYSGGSWTGPVTIIANATARGGHVNAVSDGTTIYIVWESSADASSDFYTYEPVAPTLSAKVDVSTDNQPKITLVGTTTLYVVSIEDVTEDIEVYSSATSPISWNPHSTAIPGGGFYDPCIVGDGTDLYVVSAPWDSGNDQQCLIQTKYSGGSWATAKQVSLGGYGGTYWWDYWPIAYYDGADVWVFFTTETSSPTYSDGEIAVVKMDWDLGNDHYFYIQNAIDQAVAGDTVNVAPGTYVEYTGAPSAGCAVQIPWFADGAGGLTIQSSDGPASTIIDCGQAGWGVQIMSNQITFTGFTVKNAYSVMNQVSGKGHNLSNLVITDFVNYGLGVAHGVDCQFTNITIHTNDVSKSEDRTVKGIDFIGYGSGGNNNCHFRDITISNIETTGDYGTSFGIYWSTSSTFPDWDNTFTNVTIYDLTAANYMACGIYVKGRAPGTTPYAIETTCFGGGSIYNIGGDAAATRGFYVDGGCNDLRISGFDITGCDKGIYFSHHAQEACVNVDIHWNRIVGNTEYGVQDYDGDNDVDATNNWWGTLEGGLISGMVSANVDYDPWLWTSQIHLAWGGARLVETQNTDGGWAWYASGGGSGANVIGPIGMGLAKAYRATGDSAMYNALVDGAAFMLATARFSVWDGLFAAEVDDIVGGTTNVDGVNTGFYDALAAGTYAGHAGGPYETDEFVDYILAVAGNLAGWNTGVGIVSADVCGADTSEWVRGTKDALNLLDENQDYAVLGLAGAVYGLAYIGEDYTPTSGWCYDAGCTNVSQMVALLAAQQMPSGGFTGDPGNMTAGNEAVQETGYAILALNEVGGYRDEIADAVKYLESVQLCTGGWENYVDTTYGENNEVTAEAMWALSLSNLLELNVDPADLYVKTNETVILIDMDISNLLQKVTGCQAIINFSSDYFLADPSDVGVAAGGGGVWDELIYGVWNTGGDLDVAVGLEVSVDPGSPTPGTDVDATVAKITLKADSNEGTTQVVFRADVGDLESTWLSDMAAQAVSPNKVDSLTIVIDGTAPLGFTVTAVPICTKTTTELTFATTDALSGVDYYDVSVNSTPVAWDVTSPYTLDLSSYSTGSHTVTVTAYDKAGNYKDSSVMVGVDKTAPIISNIVAEQGAGNSVLCTEGVALQGVVDIYVDVTDPGCATLEVPPDVTVDGITPVSYIGVTGDTYHYQVTVLATTTNGSHTITVTAEDDLGNTSTDATKAICVDKNQITGQVELQGFTGTGTVPTHTRVVTFVATGSVSPKTWNLTLTNVSGDVFNYTLTEVPDGTTHLSAKTAWSLRSNVAVALVDGQATADFTGTGSGTPFGGMLRGGDINGTNGVNILDYAVLKLNWLTSNAVADINGNGGVGITDYSIMKDNWFKAGDPE